MKNRRAYSGTGKDSSRKARKSHFRSGTLIVNIEGEGATTAEHTELAKITSFQVSKAALVTGAYSSFLKAFRSVDAEFAKNKQIAVTLGWHKGSGWGIVAPYMNDEEEIREVRMQRQSEAIQSLYQEEHDEIEHFSKYIPAHIRLAKK